MNDKLKMFLKKGTNHHDCCLVEMEALFDLSSNNSYGLLQFLQINSRKSPPYNITSRSWNQKSLHSNSITYLFLPKMGTLSFVLQFKSNQKTSKFTKKKT